MKLVGSLFEEEAKRSEGLLMRDGGVEGMMSMVKRNEWGPGNRKLLLLKSVQGVLDIDAALSTELPHPCISVD